MTSKDLSQQHLATFDSIKQTDEQGNEYWFARDLAPVLEYRQWRNFLPVIEKAEIACSNSQQQPSDHFAHVRKMVEIGSGAVRELNDVRLSRYACYLIVQNGDPKKAVIANGQTYFAIQTRRQELADKETGFSSLTEDEKRLAIRNELATHNKHLAAAAKDIHTHKKLDKKEQILDRMGSTELAANLFRATQTEEKLRRDNIQGKGLANQTHFDVGSKVRQTIEELGGTMPENLPTPDKSIKQLESEKKKQLKQADKK